MKCHHICWRLEDAKDWRIAIKLIHDTYLVPYNNEKDKHYLESNAGRPHQKLTLVI